MPQNRDVWMVLGGDGSLSLYKYQYPDQRKIKDENGKEYGIAGQVNMLAQRNVSTQPFCAFDWHPDKEGLAVCGSFDQCIRICAVTKLNRL